ncbi:hypothetical protein DEA8626_02534 [Defluviimonas aquaemixtae]|uniref:Uncharacterized protein n=1 Tax=Albidovulum aquaemixtae TaxID=1542388 RepID=A0A2R8BJJ9_9RHOB|nr:hypothetical protein DEA8626_02534 [Defluviimonas aquaemixtae]
MTEVMNVAPATAKVETGMKNAKRMHGLFGLAEKQDDPVTADLIAGRSARHDEIGSKRATLAACRRQLMRPAFPSMRRTLPD